MKHFFIIAFLLYSNCTFSQKKEYTIADMPFEIDSTTGGMVYRGVVEVPGVPADQLYTRAKSFLFKAFVNADAVIQIDDKSGGLLAGKGLLKPQPTAANLLLAGDTKYYTPIELRFKDGKYRYEIANIEIWVSGMKVSMDSYLREGKTKERVFTEKQYQKSLRYYQPFTDFVAELKKNMNQKSGKEDW